MLAGRKRFDGLSAVTYYLAMRVGYIGSGNMARAMARGWGEPVLCTDSGSGRAAALAAELGGEAVGSNAEVIERSELVVLAHKPAQLATVAAELSDVRVPLVSVLAGTTLAELNEAFPEAPAFRTQPNTPVALGRGVTVFAKSGPGVDPALVARVHSHFERLGAVVVVPEHLVNAAGGTSGVGPAYVAMIAEAMADAAIRRGVPPAQANVLATETLAGTAALIAERDHDTLALRREVTSPGGVTARGLAALEHAGLRAAFHSAIDAVLDA